MFQLNYHQFLDILLQHFFTTTSLSHLVFVKITKLCNYKDYPHLCKSK